MSQNTQVILLAHGSSRASWRAPFEALAARLGPTTRMAYLELCPPTLAEAVTAAVEAGITHVAVLPVFWSSGGHVTRDVPAQVEAARQVPGIASIEVLTTVGEHPKIIEALASIVDDIVDRG